MRVLILGLPGSGTSFFAGILHAHGFDCASPSFSKGGKGYGYLTLESVWGRAINRLAIGTDGFEHWPPARWNHDATHRDCSGDVELHALARTFIRENDRKHDRWFFKNPETLLAWNGLWGRLTVNGKVNAQKMPWDAIVGVYRHPLEGIRTMHSPQPLASRAVVWRRYARLMSKVCHFTARYPADAEAFCVELGMNGLPDDWKPAHPPRTQYDQPIPDWARGTWHALESKRCKSTIESEIRTR